MVKAQKMAVGEARASRPSGTRRTAELAAAAAAAPHSSYSNGSGGSGETEEFIASAYDELQYVLCSQPPNTVCGACPLVEMVLANSDLSIC